LAPPKRPVGRPKKNHSANSSGLLSDTDNSTSFFNDSFEFELPLTKGGRAGSKRRFSSPHPGKGGAMYTPSNNNKGSLNSTPFSLNLSEISPTFFNGMTPYATNGEGSLFNEFEMIVTPGVFRTPGLPGTHNQSNQKNTDNNNNNSSSYASGNKFKRKQHLLHQQSQQQQLQAHLSSSSLGVQSATTPITYGSLNILAESCIASAEKEHLLSLLSSGNGGKNILSFISRTGSNAEGEEDQDNSNLHELNLSKISKIDGQMNDEDYIEGISILNTSPRKKKPDDKERQSAAAREGMVSPLASNSNLIDANNSFTPFLQYLGEFSSGSMPFDRSASRRSGRDDEEETSASKTETKTTTAKRKYRQLLRPDDDNILSFAERIEAAATVASPANQKFLHAR
jgi:hypothetical protein